MLEQMTIHEIAEVHVVVRIARALAPQMVAQLVETPLMDVWDRTQQQTTVHTVGTPAPQVVEEPWEAIPGGIRVATLETRDHGRSS